MTQFDRAKKFLSENTPFDVSNARCQVDFETGAILVEEVENQYHEWVSVLVYLSEDASEPDDFEVVS